jgi:hypothetical protein
MHRTLLVLIIGLVGALLSFEANAAGVKLTTQQVATVCGKALKSHGSVAGCKKSCGANNEHVCEFGCSKDKEGTSCEGDCTTCGDNRTSLFPNFYANRTVRQSIRNSR